MSRKGFTDVFVEDSIVRVIVDLGEMNPEDVWLGVSKKTNSFIIRYIITNIVLEIPLPVTVTDDFVWFINNGVLEAEIKR